MAITKDQVMDLVNCTMKDCPLPSVVDVLCSSDEDNWEYMFTFIRTHYTKKQIQEGLEEFHSRVEFVQKLFGKA